MLKMIRRTPLLHISLLAAQRILLTLSAFIVVLYAGLAMAADAAPASTTASLDDPTVYLRIIFDAVENKSWGTVASAVLVLLVALFRAFGKKLHEMIPDNS